VTFGKKGENQMRIVRHKDCYTVNGIIIKAKSAEEALKIYKGGQR